MNEYNGIYFYLYIYLNILTCRAEFKKRKVIRNFCEIAKRFGKVICNCKF